MGIVMNMSNYEIERGSVETEYCDEAMRVEWNSAVALMCQCQPLVLPNKLTIAPTGLTMLNAELFMQKMYAHQRTMHSSTLTTH
jgi:hypothetical protein